MSHPLVAGHPHLATVLAAGESPRHLLLDHLVHPARLDRALTETYAVDLVDAVVERAVASRVADLEAQVADLRAANAKECRACPECDAEQVTCRFCGASLEP